MSDSESSSSSSSDSGSGNERPRPPRMQRASASNYVAPSYAALRNLPIRPIVEGNNWYGDDTDGFHQRFNTGRYCLPGEPRTTPKRPTGPESSNASMAVAVNPSQYSFSQYTPSLAGSYAPTLSSGPSAATSSGGSALSRLQRPGLLEEGEDGVLERPSIGRWQCPFRYLRCNEILDDIHAWDAHCQSHFRSRENLPKSISCPFDCDWSYQGSTGHEAWTQRWAHVWTHHSGGGGIRFARPDQWMIEHLWRIGVVNSSEKKELRTLGYLSNTPYLESANSSRDRRHERRGGEGRGPRTPRSAGSHQLVRR